MARSFTATTDHLQIFSDLTGSYNDYTFACWSYPLATSTFQQLMVESNNVSNTQRNRMAIVNTDDALTNIVTVSASSGGSISANTWHHVAATFQHGGTDTAGSYLDGSGATSSGSASRITPNVFSIGVWDRGSGMLGSNGYICEAAIWSDLLDAGDFSALAAGLSPLLVRPDILIHYWPIIGRSSPEPDLVGTANLTVTNAARASTHPKLILPGRPKIFLPAAAAPAGDTSNLPLATQTVTGFTLTDTLTQDQVSTLQLGAVTPTGFAPTALETDISNLAAGAVAPTGFTLSVNLTEGDVSNLPLGAMSVAGFTTTDTLTQNQVSNLDLGAVTPVGFDLTVLETDISVLEAGAVTPAGFTLTNTLLEGDLSNLPLGDVAMSTTLNPTDTLTQNIVSTLGAGAYTLQGFDLTNTVTTVGADTSNLGLGTQTMTGNSPSATLTQNQVSTLLSGSFILNGFVTTNTATGVVVPSRKPAGGGSGAKKKSADRGAAWYVLVDGKFHLVSSLEQERDLWKKHLEKIKEELPEGHAKVEAQTIERKILIVEKKIESRETGREERMLIRHMKDRRANVKSAIIDFIKRLR